MAESTESLKRHLDALKQALADAEAVDPHTRAELRDTLEAIDRQLERLEAGPAAGSGGATAGGEDAAAGTEDETVVDRLTGGAYRLEASHPDLALALHRIAESLSEVGI